MNKKRATILVIVILTVILVLYCFLDTISASFRLKVLNTKIFCGNEIVVLEIHGQSFNNNNKEIVEEAVRLYKQSKLYLGNDDMNHTHQADFVIDNNNRKEFLLLNYSDTSEIITIIYRNEEYNIKNIELVQYFNELAIQYSD